MSVQCSHKNQLFAVAALSGESSELIVPQSVENELCIKISDEDDNDAAAAAAAADDDDDDDDDADADHEIIVDYLTTMIVNIPCLLKMRLNKMMRSIKCAPVLKRSGEMFGKAFHNISNVT